MSSSALGTAVAAWLLRSYGFRNKVIYDILVARGIDLSDLDPAAGSTTGSASANLDKLYFTPAARSRQGGKRGSPSWVPAGVTLGDHMASTLGFADEEALARQIIRLADEPELARAMGRSGRARVEDEFGIDAMVRTYQSTYDRLLDDARCAGH